MRGCLAIPLVFGTLLALTTASYWSYGSNEERCEADLKVIRKNIILLKSTIIHLKAKIAKLPYRPKPGKKVIYINVIPWAGRFKDWLDSEVDK
uniref:Uncharacterized protein n=1 Tax=Magallana gigas TaxID=29159 RepID=K1PQB8_MAGGI